jgi:hypothetical protein
MLQTPLKSAESDNFKVLAIRSTLTRETFRSLRSMPPMCLVEVAHVRKRLLGHSGLLALPTSDLNPECSGSLVQEKRKRFSINARKIFELHSVHAQKWMQ